MKENEQFVFVKVSKTLRENGLIEAAEYVEKFWFLLAVGEICETKILEFFKKQSMSHQQKGGE